MYYTGFDTDNNYGPWEIRILELNPKQIDLRVCIARDKIIGNETVGSICSRYQAIGGINADFFKPNGDPYSAVRHKGVWYSEPDPKYESLGLYKQNGQQKCLMGRLRFDGYAIINGARYQIAGINRQRKSEDRGRILYYNAYYDDNITVPSGEWGIVFDSSIIKQVVSGKTKVNLIGEDILLTGLGRCPAVHIGSTSPKISLNVIPIEGMNRIWENCTEVISGSHVMLRGGNVIVPNRFQKRIYKQ